MTDKTQQGIEALVAAMLERRHCYDDLEAPDVQEILAHVQSIEAERDAAQTRFVNASERAVAAEVENTELKEALEKWKAAYEKMREAYFVADHECNVPDLVPCRKCERAEGLHREAYALARGEGAARSGTGENSDGK